MEKVLRRHPYDSQEGRVVYAPLSRTFSWHLHGIVGAWCRVEVRDRETEKKTKNKIELEVSC
jgi:hypothetical protein